MIGYSEVLQTMAAMIIFSMILMNANNMIHRNSMIQIDGELEQEVISLGQEIIEEARNKAYDKNAQGPVPPTIIPGGFSPTSSFPSKEEQQNNPDRSSFETFEDYHNWEEVITTTHGDFSISVEVYYVNENTLERQTGQSTFKKIEVTVQSEFLRSGEEPRKYVLEFIRNYYAD
jgi:hypothetical protein